MASDPTLDPTSPEVYQSVVPELLELCAGHELALRSLVKFAGQAVALEQREEVAAELQRRAKELEGLNVQIERTLRDQGLAAGLEKLFDALGELSHKINNPLTALMGRAQILQFKKGTDPDVTKAAEVIEESAKRIACSVRELMQVVRDGRDGLLAPSSTATPPESPGHEGQHEGED